MPTVLRVKGYNFSFYAADCHEPRHMHVDKAGAQAKYWLDPINQAWNRGFSRRQLREIEEILADHIDTLRRAWDDFCNPALPSGAAN